MDTTEVKLSYHDRLLITKGGDDIENRRQERARKCLAGTIPVRGSKKGESRFLIWNN